MMKLTIKIKGENQSYSQVEHLPDEFDARKSNQKLLDLVQNAINNCKIEAVETVKVTTTQEM